MRQRRRGGGKSVFGTHGKAYLVGETASRAIGFARAAHAGLSGPRNAFEDNRGFFELLNGGNGISKKSKPPGTKWRLVDPGLMFKTSPVCSAAHAAIDQMAELMNNANVTARDIISIEAEVPELVNISLIYPRPNSPQEAQFSLPYALACSALHGKITLADLEPEAIISEEKMKLMEKVSVTAVEDLSTREMREKYPESARLKIILADGQQLSGFCGEAYGTPGRPLSNKDLISKFDSCLDTSGHMAEVFNFDSADLLMLANRIIHNEMVTHPPTNKEETTDWNMSNSVH